MAVVVAVVVAAAIQVVVAVGLLLGQQPTDASVVAADLLGPQMEMEGEGEENPFLNSSNRTLSDGKYTNEYN